MDFGGLTKQLRVLLPGRTVAGYWGGFLALAVLAAIPFVFLALTAPSTEVDHPASLAGTSRAIGEEAGDPAPGPSLSASTGAGLAESPRPSARPTTGVPQSKFASPASHPITDESLPSPGNDFDVKCWPAATVVPGRSASVECNVLLSNYSSGEISLACRVDGMECTMTPNRLRPLPHLSSLNARMTVAAPSYAPVGTWVASVTATGGETGAALKQAAVNVNVPPPFSVSCESVGTSFVQGEKANMKCWVTFLDASSDVVSLSIRNAQGLPAGLDTSRLEARPNETQAFNIEVDTDKLQSRTYVLQVYASSNRYQQEAPASFQVVPPA